MRSRAIIIGAVIGLIVGAIFGTVVAFMYANANPDIYFDDNVVAIPELACILTISLTAIAATIGNAVAIIRSERGHNGN